MPNVLIISPSKGFKTIQEFVAAAKAKPGTFNFALGRRRLRRASERGAFRARAGFEAVHIPFKGGAEALTEVIAGRVDFYFCPIAPRCRYIREGKLWRSRSTARRARAPRCRTCRPRWRPVTGFRFPIWIGMLAPAGTPQPIIDKLSAETIKALKVPGTQDRLAKAGSRR